MSTARPENWYNATTALGQGRPALIWRKLIADTETPVGAATKLIVPGRGDYLLESVEGGAVRGRYSLLGLDPDLVFRATGNACEINRQWRSDAAAFEALLGDSLRELRTLVQSCRIADVPDELPPTLACLVGYFGYETIGLVEKLPRAPQSDLVLPDMLFVRPTLILVFARLSDELFCVAPVWPSEVEPLHALDAAQERIDEALRRLTQPVPALGVDARLPEPALTPTLAPGAYREMVLKAQDYIAAGDIF